MPDQTLSITVGIPCLNEELTIAEVVTDFRNALPSASIVVFDNGSTDRTSEVAKEAGASVVPVPQRGKGNAVRAMFAEIDSDILLMADGDGTYNAADAPKLVAHLVDNRLDMVVGARKGVTQDAGRKGHAFGNWVFNTLFQRIFNIDLQDIFSGYRAFSRRFYKSFPAVSHGFEIETEMSVHAYMTKLPVAETSSEYGKRPEGSASKLSTIKDGTRILSYIVLFAKEIRPFMFFGILSLLTAIVAVFFLIPPIVEYAHTGLVSKVPTWIAGVSLSVIALMFFVCGLILDTVARTHRETKRLFALQIPKW